MSNEYEQNEMLSINHSEFFFISLCGCIIFKKKEFRKWDGHHPLRSELFDTMSMHLKLLFFSLDSSP